MTERSYTGLGFTIGGVEGVNLVKRARSISVGLGGDDGRRISIDSLNTNGLSNGFTDSNLVSSPWLIRIDTADFGAVVLDSLRSVLRRGVSENCNKLGADDNSLSDTSDSKEVFPGRDAKSNSDRLVARAFVHTFAQRWKTRIELASSASDAHARHHIDERVCN